MTALFSPGRIGAVEVPNRVVMPAMTTRLAAPARPLPPPAEWRRLVAEDHEYERYAVRGVFERDREALIMRPSGKVAGAPCSQISPHGSMAK